MKIIIIRRSKLIKHNKKTQNTYYNKKQIRRTKIIRNKKNTNKKKHIQLIT